MAEIREKSSNRFAVNALCAILTLCCSCCNANRGRLAKPAYRVKQRIIFVFWSLPMTISFKDRVAIVTGAGGGLGREYALELARRGAKVVVNDLGGARDGTGHSDSALQVVEEIKAAGGEAFSNGGSVTEYDQAVEMVAKAKEAWGGVHILINNAGILRDKSFAKMDMADFELVLKVHVMGSANCTKAVWDLMREQVYGRILMTASSTGLYGNFGQANYGAAKLGLAGLTKSLYLEGAKYNVRVNTIAPLAGTRMTQDIMPEEAYKAFDPVNVVPAALFLVSEDCPSNVIMGAGGGFFHTANVTMTRGKVLHGDDRTPEGVATHFAEISDRAGETVPQSGGEQALAAMTRMQEN
jgi:NAD(P)-dependent dehydrogenase (short-subunit alcohol dehydrogenase family)